MTESFAGFELEIPAHTDAPPEPPQVQSVEVPIPEATKKCLRCMNHYPANTLYFQKHGNGLLRFCHCCYRENQVEKGIECPPAKNGVEQSEYRKSLKSSASMADKPKPWLTKFPPANTAAPPASSSAPAPTLSAPSKPRVTEGRDGTVIIKMTDYLGSNPENMQAVKVKHTSPLTPAPKKGTVAAPASSSSAPAEEGEEEMTPEEYAEMIESMRIELMECINAHPNVAAICRCNLADVGDYTPKEVEKYHYMMNGLKNYDSNSGMFHFLLVVATGVIELGATSNEEIKETVNLTGFTYAVKEDPHIKSAMREIVQEYSTEINEMIGPETRLAVHWFGNLVNTALVNAGMPDINHMLNAPPKAGNEGK